MRTRGSVGLFESGLDFSGNACSLEESHRGCSERCGPLPCGKSAGVASEFPSGFFVGGSSRDALRFITETSGFCMPDARTLTLFSTALFLSACVCRPESRVWHRDGWSHSSQPNYRRNPRYLNRHHQNDHLPDHPPPGQHPAWDGMGGPHEFYRGGR